MDIGKRDIKMAAFGLAATFAAYAMGAEVAKSSYNPAMGLPGFAFWSLMFGAFFSPLSDKDTSFVKDAATWAVGFAAGTALSVSVMGADVFTKFDYSGMFDQKTPASSQMREIAPPTVP